MLPLAEALNHRVLRRGSETKSIALKSSLTLAILPLENRDVSFIRTSDCASGLDARINRPLLKCAAWAAACDLSRRDWRQAFSRLISERPQLYSVLVTGLCLVLSSCGGGGDGASSQPPILVLSVSPSTVQAYDSTSFSVAVSADVRNTTAPVTVTMGSLPDGLTTTTKFPLTIPAAGASINFSSSAALPTGSYSIPLHGEAGTTTASASVQISILAGTPPPFFFSVQVGELGVTIGGSAQLQISSGLDGSGAAPYQVNLSLGGLPAGTSATIKPQIITPGQATTVTISASKNAPVTENASVTLTGVASAQVPNASLSFLVDVTQPAGSAPDSRTDYVSTEGTPYAAAYDSVHNLIYASNPAWNRVDVISNTTHQIMKSIDIRDPRGLALTKDGQFVAVATGSQQIYSINTTTFAATRYLLPQFAVYQGDGLSTWEGEQIYPLSDGTVLLGITGATGSGNFDVVLWDPSDNSLSRIKPPSGGQFPASWGIIVPSGDGTRVYSIGDDSGGSAFYYDVATKKVSGVKQLGEYGYAAAANSDGSRVAVEDGNGFNMYDGDLNLIGSIPGGGGNLLFSPDNKYLYVEGGPYISPLILTIDTTSLQITNEAPGMPVIPVMVELSPPYYVPVPFGVDSTGILLGIEDWGIAFDDSTYTVNLNANDPGDPTYLQHMSPYFGPLTGGTTSGGFGNAFAVAPDIWYGSKRGKATLQQEILSITSPPSSTSGPVNLKFLFPDGTEAFDPLFFTYGSYPQYAILSGAPPGGGVPGQISGYGIPYDSSGGTVSVGGNEATITSQLGQYLPFTEEPFPTTFLNFTIPSGAPGWADISVTTPAGSGAIPKSIYYATSVTDYSIAGSPNAVLYDPVRQQLYISTKSKVDVFSLSTLSFATPIKPPSQNSSTEFAGMALTSNGTLLVADLADGSMAVVDPDNSANSYYIPISTPPTGSGCQVGPLYVAGSGTGQAFVVNGGLPAIGCGPGGTVYQVNLTTKTPTSLYNNCGGGYLSSSNDGSIVAMGQTPDGGGSFCTYNNSTGTYYKNYAYQGYGAAAAGDGSVLAGQWLLSNRNAELVGRVALPFIYYSQLSNAASSNFYPLQQPQMNISGSLYFVAYPLAFDIIDVSHGRLRLRFSLSEKVSTAAAPIAIDSAGANVYLLTNKGLTIVNLGSAPLSIGHIDPSPAAAGTLVTVSGSGFAASTGITVGGVAVGATFVSDTTLQFTMPSLTAGAADVVVTNPDGSTYTLQSGVSAQ
jgi:hypothetical protein